MTPEVEASFSDKSRPFHDTNLNLQCTQVKIIIVSGNYLLL